MSSFYFAHMFNQINEIIDVVAIFKDGKLTPAKFSWQGREYRVERVNLRYSRFEGRSKVCYFAVNDLSNYFKLRFDTDKMQWILVENYVE